MARVRGKITGAFDIRAVDGAKTPTSLSRPFPEELHRQCGSQVPCDQIDGILQ